LEIRAATQGAFFSDTMQLIATRLSELTGKVFPVQTSSNASSAIFRGFISECLERLEGDMVLMIDPLEALPTDMIQALLTSLRAVYMDQQTQDEQITVVVSGALSLASLTVGESSPFRGIAQRVFVGDLSEEDSHALILEFLAKFGVSATKPAIDKLLLATRGDTYLIRKLSHRGAEMVASRSSKRLGARDVNRIMDRFLSQDVFEYAPLVEGTRLIEEDPDLLQCILMLLDHECVPRTVLPLPLSPDLDPLYLTGLVEIIEGDHYRLQNLIYRRFFASHFTPGHVGQLLSMAGRWDSAIDFLEASVNAGNAQSRVDILPATVNSIYASEDIAQAVYFLRRGLSAAFEVSRSQVWLSNPQEKKLELVGPADIRRERNLGSNPHVGISLDRLEARAYRQGILLRGQEGSNRIVRAVPLKIPGSKPLGVVTIYDDRVEDLFSEQRERDLQLMGFLSQAARALKAVRARRQELALAGRMQTSLLPDNNPNLPGWQIASIWKPARETSGDFYDFISMPNGHLGILIADVVDKGMGAALLMALTRTLIRTYATEYPEQPEKLMHIVNQRIFEDSDAGLFVSLFFGVLDPTDGTLTYCNAGHPPPFIFSTLSPQVKTTLDTTGLPLGMSDNTSWNRESARIDSKALLILYTDGILDARNLHGRVFGEQGVIETVTGTLGQHAAEVADALISEVYAFAGTVPQVDDITLVALAHD
jgi:serine phosphatase RsbU (regulator of sigma subunit)